MITAKDINNKRFEQARPGYSPAEVDDFLRDLAKEVSKYQKEKEEFEKKIEILVESVREYKKDEEALKDALIGAQKQGRAVISEAQQKAEVILANATEKAGDIIGSTKSQLDKEKRNLAKMQKEVSKFKSELLAMYKLHLEQITSIPDYDDDDAEEEIKKPFKQQSGQPVNMEDTTDVDKTPPVTPGVSANNVIESEDELEKFSAVAARKLNNEIPPEFIRDPDHSERPPLDELKNPNRAGGSRFGDLKFGNNS